MRGYHQRPRPETRDDVDIKLLTEVEKESIGERQPLPDRYLRLSDDEMDARIAASTGPRCSHTDLPAIRAVDTAV